MNQIKESDARLMGCDAVIHDYGIYCQVTFKAGNSQPFNSVGEAQLALSSGGGTYVLLDERIGGLGAGLVVVPQKAPSK